jgi:hypothetical protein
MHTTRDVPMVSRHSCLKFTHNHDLRMGFTLQHCSARSNILQGRIQLTGPGKLCFSVRVQPTQSGVRPSASEFLVRRISTSPRACFLRPTHHNVGLNRAVERTIVFQGNVEDTAPNNEAEAQQSRRRIFRGQAAKSMQLRRPGCAEMVSRLTAPHRRRKIDQSRIGKSVTLSCGTLRGVQNSCK